MKIFYRKNNDIFLILSRTEGVLTCTHIGYFESKIKKKIRYMPTNPSVVLYKSGVWGGGTGYISDGHVILITQIHVHVLILTPDSKPY